MAEGFWGDIPLTVSIWPFGENAVMTATGLKGGKAFIVARAVPDGFHEQGASAAEAWAENERIDGPCLYLSFATPESARNMATQLEELAVALETQKPDEE